MKRIQRFFPRWLSPEIPDFHTTLLQDQAWISEPKPYPGQVLESDTMHVGSVKDQPRTLRQRPKPLV